MSPRKSARRRGYCITLDSLVKDVENGVEVSRFLNFAFFYKANAVLIITTGYDLSSIEEAQLEDVVRHYNDYMEGKYSISTDDFRRCEKGKGLSSDKLIEMKEYLKSSKRPYSQRTSKTFYTTIALWRLAEASSQFNIRIGDTKLFAVIEVPREILGRRELGELNRRFRQLASNLNYVEAYMLATSLVATALKNCVMARAKFVTIRDRFYTSTSLPVENLCRKRHFAEFYVELVRSKSDFVDVVASALFTYAQTGRTTALYDIIRNTSQTKRLSKGDVEALARITKVYEEGD